MFDATGEKVKEIGAEKHNEQSVEVMRRKNYTASERAHVSPFASYCSGRYTYGRNPARGGKSAESTDRPSP